MAAVWERSVSIPPKQARAWFFDLGPDDHSGPAHAKLRAGKAPDPRDKRVIVSRGPDTIIVDDSWDAGKMQMRSTVKLVGSDRILMEGVGKGFNGTTTMAFVPERQGTRLTMDMEMRPRGLFRLLMPLFKGKFHRTIRADMDAHAEELELDWKKSPW